MKITIELDERYLKVLREVYELTTPEQIAAWCQGDIEYTLEEDEATS